MSTSARVRPGLCHTCDWKAAAVSRSARGLVVLCEHYKQNRTADDVVVCEFFVQGQRYPNETPEQFRGRREQVSRSEKELALDVRAARKATLALIISLLALLASAINAWVALHPSR